MTDSTFAAATSVLQADPHTYLADFPDDWCIGSVPHGGFVTSVFLRVVSDHFRTTLSKQDQPDTIVAHLEFLRRTQTGPATFKVKDVKLGQQTSTVHVSLIQGDREEVVGYFTNSNMSQPSGLTVSTGFRLDPTPLPADLARLATDTDMNWKWQESMPFPKFRKASNKVKMYLPRNGQLHPSLADQWLAFANGEKFTSESLGYVADIGPQLIESHLQAEPDAKPPSSDPGPARYWYPTLVLNLDIKKKLPDEGVEWLFGRIRAKQIKDGRMDLEFVILDATGDIVAVSHHVSLILDSARNLADRRKDKDESKI